MSNIGIEDFLRKIASEHAVYEECDPIEEIYRCRSCDTSWTDIQIANAHISTVQAAGIREALRGMYELGYDNAEDDYRATGYWGQGKRNNPYGTPLTEQEAFRVQLGRPIWGLPSWVAGSTQL